MSLLDKAGIHVEMFGKPLQTAEQVQIGSSVWSVPTEVPAAFVFNGRNYSVMMSTPDDLVNFAIGFSLSEKIIDGPGDIQSLAIHRSGRGVEFRITLNEEMLARFDSRQSRRNMIGRAGCGICGLDSVDLFIQKLPKVPQPVYDVDPNVIRQAFENFRSHQTLNQSTRSVHGAAWVDWRGRIQFVREDVGRHNALDKLIGAILCNEVDVESGFILLSSRCSYELIEKAARCGVGVLATISAPTLLATAKAEEAGISLYCRCEEEFQLVSAS